MSNEYKNKFYRTANRNATERKLAAILFRTYKKNPAEAYGILEDLSKYSNEQDKQRLLEYIDKLHQRKNIIDFVGFYMLHRVTVPNNPRLKRIYWQSNLALLYPELPEREARLKALRSSKKQHFNDDETIVVHTPETIVETPTTKKQHFNDEETIVVHTPETIVETPTTNIQTPNNIFQTVVGHIKERFGHLK